MKNKKLRFAFGIVVASFLFFLSIPIWADDDYDDEGLNDDQKAEADAYAGIYNPANYDDFAGWTWEGVSSGLGAAVDAYNQALASRDSEKIIEAERALHTAEEQMVMFADAHQDQYSISYTSTGHGLSTTVSDKSTGDTLLTTHVGDPVMIKNGALVLNNTDLTVSSYGMTFDLNRYYSTDTWMDTDSNGGVFGVKYYSILDSRLVQCNKNSDYGLGRIKAKHSRIETLKQMVQDMSENNYDDNAEDVLPAMVNLYYKEYLEYCEAYENFLKEYYNRAKLSGNNWGPVKIMAEQYDERSFIYVDEIGTPIIFDKLPDYQNVYECTYDKLLGKMQIIVGNKGVPIGRESTAYEPELFETIEDENVFENVDIHQVKTTEEILELKIPWVTVKGFSKEDDVLLKESQKSSESDIEYFVKHVDGSVKVFNEKGLLSRVENGRGGKICFERDTSSKVVKVVLNDAKEINFNYNREGKLIEALHGDKKVKYSYSRDQIATFTDSKGDTQKFEYNMLNLTKFTRADNSYSSYEYIWENDDDLEAEECSAKVTYTKNENFDSERFDYGVYKRTVYDEESKKKVTVSCPMITYSDQDGVSTKIWMDELHRNLKETTDDGLTKTFEWNGNNLSASVAAGDRTEYDYDEANNLISKLYSDGGKETWTYENRKLTTYTKKDGNVFGYVYDSNGCLTSVTLNGVVVSRSVFGNKGELKRMYDKNGSYSEFTYDNSGNVCKVEKKDKNGKVLGLNRYGYDISGQVVWIEDFYGVRTDITYGDHVAKYKCSTGLEKEVYYSKRGATVKEVLKDTNTGKTSVTEYTWDKCNNLLKVTVNGVVMEEYAYSKAGRIVKKIKAFDDTKNYLYEFTWSKGQLVKTTVCFADKKNVPLTSKKETTFENIWQVGERKLVVKDGNWKKTYLYDLEDHLKSLDINGVSGVKNDYSPEGKLVHYKDGPNGIVQFNYDQWGNCSGTEEIDGTLKSDFRTFDETGTLLSWADRRGIVTNYSYDGTGNICRSSSIQGKNYLEYENGYLTSKKIEDGKGKLLYEERFEYYPKERKTVYVKGNKYKTEIVRNAFGQIILESDGSGTKQYVYDDFGNCVETKDGYGNKNCYEYNFDGSLAKTITPDGNIIEYEYDVMGNCVRAEDCNGDLFRGKYDALGRIIESEKRPFSYVEKFEYDELNRVVKVTHGNTVVLTTDYDDVLNRKIEIDSAGNKIFYETDGFSRIRKITDRLGAVKELSFGHDGSVELCSDFEKSVTEYSFSDDGLELLIKYSDGTYVKQQKDFAGRIVRIENESGSQIYDYDTGGKLVRQIDGFTGKEVVYKWNERGLLENVRGAGRNTSYVYGKNRELLKVTEISDSFGLKTVTVVNEEYDSCGRLIREKFDTGEEQRYEYDKGGRLVLTSGYDSVGKVVFVEGKVYDENGFVSMVLNSDFTVTRFEYDEMGRLAKTQYVYNDVNLNMFSEMCLKNGIYNAGIEAKVKRVNFTTEEFEKLKCLAFKVSLGQYQVQRLYDVFEESYKYDSRGNMIERCTPYGIVSYKYDKENRMTSWGNGSAAEYDANGNMIFQKDSISENKFTYSKMNRIKDAKITNLLDESVEVIGYGYDGFGRRNYETKKSGSYKTTYEGLSFRELFSEFNPSLYEETDGNKYGGNGYRYNESGTARSSTAVSYDNHSYAPMFGARCTPVALLYIDDNEAASRRLYSNSNGSVGAEVEAGTVISKNHKYDVFGKPVSAEIQYGFGGKKYDSSIEMYDFGYRHYNPGMSRFSSVDPLRDGYNWYGYCNNNPVSFVDPDGRKVVETSEMHMQDYGSTQVGNSTAKGDTMENVGCLVTAFAEVMSALSGDNITPDIINSITSAFEKGGSAMYMDQMAAAFGRGIEIRDYSYIQSYMCLGSAISVIQAFANDPSIAPSLFYGAALELFYYTMDPWGAALYEVMEPFFEDDNVWAIIAEVIYSSDNKSHFVTVTGNVFNHNGIAYVPIQPTSKNDRSVGKGSLRNGVGWVMINGKVCIPAKNVHKIVAIEK